MIEILRKDGWELNPNDKIVNAILRRCEVNNGECPCVNPGETHEDRLCPCKEYRENDVCHCSLYVKKGVSKPTCFACDESEDCVVNVLHCSNCGAEVRVYQNNK